jgi:hypothetical protein
MKLGVTEPFLHQLVDVVVREMPVPVLVAVSVTPGRTAPVESTTRPAIPPRNVCALAVAANATMSAIDQEHNLVMNPSPSDRFNRRQQDTAAADSCRG